MANQNVIQIARKEPLQRPWVLIPLIMGQRNVRAVKAVLSSHGIKPEMCMPARREGSWAVIQLKVDSVPVTEFERQYLRYARLTGDIVMPV